MAKESNTNFRSKSRSEKTEEKDSPPISCGTKLSQK